MVALLKKGTMVPATIVAGGLKQAVFLSINAKAGRIDMRDEDLKIIDLRANG